MGQFRAKTFPFGLTSEFSDNVQKVAIIVLIEGSQVVGHCARLMASTNLEIVPEMSSGTYQLCIFAHFVFTKTDRQFFGQTMVQINAED